MNSACFNMHNYDRRLGFDRRQFSYSSYFPERRAEGGRRSGFDRRRTDALSVENDRRR